MGDPGGRFSLYGTVRTVSHIQTSSSAPAFPKPTAPSPAEATVTLAVVLAARPACDINRIVRVMDWNQVVV
jgi:hypothetical protein